jgi:phospholipid transport system substrate-binding protein
VTNTYSSVCRFVGLAVALLLPVGAAAEPAAAPASTDHAPTQAVEDLHKTLLGVMQEADSLGYQGRYDRLAPVLQALFDFAFMAEKSVGRHWKTANDEDRKTLVETFTRFSIANYAGRFDGYSGQQFETLTQEPSTIPVKTACSSTTGCARRTGTGTGGSSTST